MRKTYVALLVAILLCVPVNAGEKPLFGLSFPTLISVFFNTLDEHVKEKAKELDVNVVSIEANNEVSRQLSVLEDMRTKGVKGILLVPTETEAVIPGVESLNEAKIPVVTIDRRLAEEAHHVEVLAHVGADNVLGGQKAAHFIVDHITRLKGKPEGTVIELYGLVGAGPAIDRSSGFQEVMEKYPGITVKTQTASFYRVDAMKVMEDFIMSTPEIDGVFAANDEMALGAIEAMEASGKFDFSKVVTVGFDTIQDALKSISEGRMTATIEQYPGRQASIGFEVMVDYVVHGKTPENKLILLDPIVITKNNLDAAETGL